MYINLVKTSQLDFYRNIYSTVQKNYGIEILPIGLINPQI
jgi:hypothetical protein